jgi:hypothetical protein
MKWFIEANDRCYEDSTGVENFVKRMELEFRNGGPPIEGFHFLNSPFEMLDYSREIENEVRTNPQNADLYVGFQTYKKVTNGILNRYSDLLGAGVKIVGFGEGVSPFPSIHNGLEWIPLKRDVDALENQWYLVSLLPTPIAFVGWETSPAKNFGIGGLSTPGKRFKGFVTNDLRVVEGIVDHLESLRPTKTPTVMWEPSADGQDKPVINRILTITHSKQSSELLALQSSAVAIALSQGADMLLYEMSAASYLISPYPEGDKGRWLRPLDAQELTRFGRGEVTSQLNEIKSKGVQVKAILPVTHGFKHLAEWAEKEEVDLIILPSSLVNSNLLNRLRGYNLTSLLEHSKKRIIVLEPDGDIWQANEGTTERIGVSKSKVEI